MIPTPAPHTAGPRTRAQPPPLRRGCRGSPTPRRPCRRRPPASQVSLPDGAMVRQPVNLGKLKAKACLGDDITVNESMCNDGPSPSRVLAQ